MSLAHSLKRGLFVIGLGAVTRYVWQRLGAHEDRLALAAGPDNRPRLAGPHKRDGVKGWDEVDEVSDQSFPASDPPGRY